MHPKQDNGFTNTFPFSLSQVYIIEWTRDHFRWWFFNWPRSQFCAALNPINQKTVPYSGCCHKLHRNITTNHLSNQSIRQQQKTGTNQLSSGRPSNRGSINYKIDLFRRSVQQQQQQSVSRPQVWFIAIIIICAPFDWSLSSAVLCMHVGAVCMGGNWLWLLISADWRHPVPSRCAVVVDQG